MKSTVMVKKMDMATYRYSYASRVIEAGNYTQKNLTRILNESGCVFDNMRYSLI